MYASTVAWLACQAARRARPRPGCSSRTARTPLSSAARSSACAQVPSRLSLSAIVMQVVNGNPAVR